MSIENKTVLKDDKVVGLRSNDRPLRGRVSQSLDCSRDVFVEIKHTYKSLHLVRWKCYSLRKCHSFSVPT